jgi:TonB family protein
MGTGVGALQDDQPVSSSRLLMKLSIGFVVSLLSLIFLGLSGVSLAQPSSTPTKITHVDPVYPEQARQARIQGSVIVQITIGTDGRVSNARVIRSLPMLDQAALDAVKQWVYDASAIKAPVTFTVTVPFAVTVPPPTIATPRPTQPAPAPASAMTRSIEDVIRNAASLSFSELRRSPPCRTNHGQESFMPVGQDEVDAMLKVAKVTARDRIYDLTYSDGLLAETAATKFGAQAIVIPICANGMTRAFRSAGNAGGDRMTVLDRDFFATDLSDATVVTLHLLPALNAKLLPKLMRELRPGTRVVSRAFTVAGWEPDVTLSVGSQQVAVYMWTVR